MNYERLMQTYAKDINDVRRELTDAKRQLHNVQVERDELRALLDEIETELVRAAYDGDYSPLRDVVPEVIRKIYIALQPSRLARVEQRMGEAGERTT